MTDKSPHDLLAEIPTNPSQIPWRPADALTPARRLCIATRKCFACESEVHSFRDTISVKEYAISGMCQECQDTTFK
jgi:hypothetical protein